MPCNRRSTSRQGQPSPPARRVAVRWRNSAAVRRFGASLDPFELRSSRTLRLPSPRPCAVATRDLKHDRPATLKVLHPNLAHALGSERFHREIRFAARLQHPHGPGESARAWLGEGWTFTTPRAAGRDESGQSCWLNRAPRLARTQRWLGFFDRLARTPRPGRRARQRIGDAHAR
jgi:hypothetical protein